MGVEYRFPCTMSRSVESQKHMFLIRPSHCLHVVTMSRSVHPPSPTLLPIDFPLTRGGCNKASCGVSGITQNNFEKNNWCLLYCIHMSPSLPSRCSNFQWTYGWDFVKPQYVTHSSVCFSSKLWVAPVLRLLLAKSDYFKSKRAERWLCEKKTDCWISHVLDSCLHYSIKHLQLCHIS
jgi:hypothetical protein